MIPHRIPLILAIAMSREVLASYLTSIHPELNPQDLEEYCQAWKEYSFPKKTLMTSEGQIQKTIFFVLEGVQKSYFLNNGKEHVIAFTYAPGFTGIPESFFTQTPSNYFLETISESKMLGISYDQHIDLLHKYRSIETLFRKATELILLGLIQRHQELMSFDIETRFIHFMKRSPHLLQMVNHKDIASYLRIDPTNFSKLLQTVKI